MKHLGSVTDIKGDEVEPVDVITFGSPCQDLSVAGKRAGLKHTDNGDEETTRSGLFMEAVRIIKEMRDATNGKYPRFAVWENVPGAFSSNKGEDFRVVLEELIKIVEPSAVMPAVPKNGWNYADCFIGDGWSLAYRVLDAQYWGVPQRRRRIYLVLDLGGQCAGEISFKRDGLRGDFTEGRTPWQTVAGDVADRSGTTNCEGTDGVISVDQGGGKSGANFHHELSPTLTCTHGGEPAVAYGWPLGFRPENTRVYEETATTICNGTRPGFTCGVIEPVAYGISPYHSNCMKSSNPHSGIYVADTARTLDAMNCGYPGCNQGGIAVVEPLCMATQQGGAEIMEDKCPTITAATGMSGNNQPVVTYSIENHPADSRVNIDDSGKVQTLTSRMGTGGGNVPMVMEPVVYRKGTRPHSADEAQKWEEAETSNTLNTFDIGETRSSELIVEPTTVCIEGNGSLPSHIRDGYKESEQHSVAYSLETFHCEAEEEKTAPLKARDYKDPICVAIDRVYFNAGQNAQYTPQTYEDGTSPTLVARGPSGVAYGVDCRNATEYEESNGALQASCNHNHNSNNVVRVQYIVRRLTPTECARLQGFPDRWATPETKDGFTDEEYEFWLNVRNTNAEINGKAVKDYTKDQMLKWYNKLHTDSAEYKLWGNGIALPCALYVMQGIAEVFANERN
jgi:DNA (cytosine-5)-methyltransferase 1